MSQATIVTIVGTRPEIIRLSRVLPAMDAAFNHILVHTGQNTDPNLSEIFFKELDIRKPDYYLDVDTSSLGSVLGDTLKKVEKVFLDHTPDGVLILGDTNSAISAVLAKRMQIPVYHMEAGNRSFDENVPEETNRRLVDHASDFNLPYTEHARRNLLSEGMHPRRVMVTGSPMREVLDLSVLAALALIAPPLVAFAIYFGCWHAMRHTARLTLILPKAKSAAEKNNAFGSFLAAW
jgi:UDP-N-acetylglucosamine 2-epimerase (non-hydrolysing)